MVESRRTVLTNRLPMKLLCVFLAARAILDSDLDWIAWTGCVLMATGVGMNLTVIVANRGLMPAALPYQQLSEDNEEYYTPFAPDTRLGFHGDWIDLGRYLISPGDIVLVIGAVLMIANMAM